MRNRGQLQYDPVAPLPEGDLHGDPIWLKLIFYDSVAPRKDLCLEMAEVIGSKKFKVSLLTDENGRGWKLAFKKIMISPVYCRGGAFMSVWQRLVMQTGARRFSLTEFYADGTTRGWEPY